MQTNSKKESKNHDLTLTQQNIITQTEHLSPAFVPMREIDQLPSAEKG